MLAGGNSCWFSSVKAAPLHPTEGWHVSLPLLLLRVQGTVVCIPELTSGLVLQGTPSGFVLHSIGLASNDRVLLLL